MAKKTEKPDAKPDETPDDDDIREEHDDEHEPDADDEPDTFTREYVEGLRADIAKYRTKARDAEERADTVSRQLFRLRVEQTGRLADADDLDYDPDLLSDDEKLSGAIDSLLDVKPHLKSRAVRGELDQGVRGDNAGPTDFLGIMRSQL